MSVLLSGVGKQRINAEGHESALCDRYRRAVAPMFCPLGLHLKERLILRVLRTICLRRSVSSGYKCR